MSWVLLRGGQFDGRVLKWDRPSLALPVVGRRNVFELEHPDLLPLTEVVHYDVSYPREYEMIVTQDVPAVAAGTPVEDMPGVVLGEAVVFRPRW